ncbi:hypothetical protein EJ08DRAFT_281972 [Tothia fuscella]|uniref:Uncharacterized protein n=1 Tax=Tothia fuscella TaxID=1048955 RepID=A0A9P4U421_9PEZI|nr:hypothetical protein EJ08DRAFT_281972 [Tothia fuscella]
MLLRPIPSIAEVSERDSGDFEKTMPKLTLDFSAPSPNPFDDSHDVEKPKLLPEMSSFRRKPPPPPMSERSKQHLRSRSFDSLQEQQASVDVELDQAMRLGRMNYYNRHGGQQHDFYGNPQNHPYHRNGPINPLRMHSVQRTRRTASMSGRNPRYPRNPVLDGPAWRQALPPLQRPSLIHGIQFPVNSLQETTLTRAPSFRERPSPELWAGPKISAPLHLSRSNTHTARPRTVERSPDNSCSTAWGSVSNYVQGDRPGGVGTARNF